MPNYIKDKPKKPKKTTKKTPLKEPIIETNNTNTIINNLLSNNTIATINTLLSYITDDDTDTQIKQELHKLNLLLDYSVVYSLVNDLNTLESLVDKTKKYDVALLIDKKVSVSKLLLESHKLRKN